ncbi:MAG: calcium-binding protein, partial [Pseudomonadota bacterium]
MTGLSSGEQVIQSLGDNVSSVQVVTLGGGGFAVAYRGSGTSGSSVFVRVFDANGDLIGGPIDAASVLSNPQTPVLAALADGGFGLAYQFLTGPGASDANAITFDADGSVRSGPITISTTGVVFDIPRVANSVGDGYVVLMQGAGPTISMFAEIDANGAPQTTVPSFIGNPGVDATTPNDIAEGRNGVYALLYTDFENTDRQLRLQIREFGEGVITDVTVAGETSGRAAGLGDGFVVAGGSGDFIFIDAAGQETGRTAFAVTGAAVVDLVTLSDGKVVVLYALGDDDFVQILGTDGAFLSDATTVPGLVAGGAASRVIVSETSTGDLLFTRDRAGDGDQIAQIIVDPEVLISEGGGDQPGDDPVGDDPAGDDPDGDAGDDDPSTGTNGPDDFVGGTGPDRFDGGAGNDTAVGGGGADTLSGGQGRDELSGGGGGDRLNGGGGRDLLNGNGGSDTLSGGGGNDRLNGNGGADVLAGGGGNDRLNGGGGRDALNGNGGSDTLAGGGGNDRLNGGGGRDALEGGGGRDRL